MRLGALAVLGLLATATGAARADCPAPRECAVTGEDPRAWNDAAVKAIDLEADRAACLADKATRASLARGDKNLAAAGQFNLGWAQELRACPREAWDAYRASLCLRPEGTAAGVVAGRCRELGTCDRPCEATGDTYVPWTHVRVHPGNTASAPFPAGLCSGGCGSADGRRLRVGRSDYEIVVIGGHGYDVVVIRRLPDDQAKVVFRRQLPGLLAAEGDAVEIDTGPRSIAIQVTSKDGRSVKLSLQATADRVSALP